MKEEVSVMKNEGERGCLHFFPHQRLSWGLGGNRKEFVNLEGAVVIEMQDINEGDNDE